jgi:hypothetical protein
MIREEYDRGKSIFDEFEKSGRDYTPAEVLRAIKKSASHGERTPENIDFFEFGKTHIARLIAAEKGGRAENFDTMLKSVKAYLRGSETLPVTSINLKWYNAYKAHIKSLKDGNELYYSKYSIFNLLKDLKALLNKAYEEYEELLGPTPTGKFKNERVKTKAPVKARLTAEEMNAYRSCDFPEGSAMWHARNIWLFQYNNAGMRISDALTVRVGSLQKVFRYTMRKTGDHMMFDYSETDEANTEILSIIRNYLTPDVDTDSFLFPYLRGLENADAETIRKATV